MALVLNHEYGGRLEGRAHVSRVLSGPASPAQGLALGRLGQAAESLLQMNKRDLRAIEWAEELKSRRIDYSMNEISTPHKLTVEQIKPGLPPKGVAASVDASELAVGEIREILLNPGSIIRPPERWEKLPGGRASGRSK
jgi:hypothetical protein